MPSETPEPLQKSLHTSLSAKVSDGHGKKPEKTNRVLYPIEIQRAVFPQTRKQYAKLRSTPNVIFWHTLFCTDGRRCLLSSPIHF
ncbi:hypothetical protein BV912_05110 [Neisseria dumasiana]|uniref:Uncharacterized protein n=1 Tax=Neisseria dumasiana TaxID=1931275 RepID=A0A1X3DJ54_9NEIS|nr:hypothetical protein BV912_05110 [Neisseria dumasiana]